MNKLQLLRLLRKHVKLAEKRSLAYEQNKVAKVLINYIGGAFGFGYVVFISIKIALFSHD